MTTRLAIIIAIVLLAACGANPLRQSSGQQSAEAPKSKSCVNRCTKDYGACVEHAGSDKSMEADCEPVFRACVNDC